MIWQYQVRHFVTLNGRDPFSEWRNSIQDSRTRIAIDRRINRLVLGNFGDHRPCREGVWELRIDEGPGYRVYYARASQVVVLLLCGGTKRTQEKDIARACKYWFEWQQARSIAR
jgi:putative addiction module killer protein